MRSSTRCEPAALVPRPQAGLWSRGFTTARAADLSRPRASHPLPATEAVSYRLSEQKSALRLHSCCRTKPETVIRNPMGRRNPMDRAQAPLEVCWPVKALPKTGKTRHLKERGYRVVDALSHTECAGERRDPPSVAGVCHHCHPRNPRLFSRRLRGCGPTTWYSGWPSGTRTSVSRAHFRLVDI